jgi:hypothetical protein
MFGVAISPHDSRVIVAGGDMGNAFLTRDGGKTWKILGRNGGASWEPIADDIPLSPGGEYNKVVFAPTGPSRFFVLHNSGTYEGHEADPARVDTSPKKGKGPFFRNGPEGASHKRGLSPFSPSKDSDRRSKDDQSYKTAGLLLLFLATGSPLRAQDRGETIRTKDDLSLVLSSEGRVTECGVGAHVEHDMSQRT